MEKNHIFLQMYYILQSCTFRKIYCSKKIAAELDQYLAMRLFWTTNIVEVSGTMVRGGGWDFIALPGGVVI